MGRYAEIAGANAERECGASADRDRAVRYEFSDATVAVSLAARVFPGNRVLHRLVLSTARGVKAWAAR
jgi:hypothetical protein